MNATTQITNHVPTLTPWGVAENIEPIADGIVYVSTARGGGMWLSPERLAKVPPSWRTNRFGRQRESVNDPWFEEKSDWAMVALSHSDAFQPEAVRVAASTFAKTIMAKTLESGRAVV